MNIQAVIIDSREPDWVKKMDFGAPSLVQQLETGDMQLLAGDGATLTIERKTPEDFLSSLRDGRLMTQMTRLAELRYTDLLKLGSSTNWPYLVITGQFGATSEGKVTTATRATGWDYAAIYGAILSIQEMGVFVVFCDGDTDYGKCAARLAERKRTSEQYILPPRPAYLLGPKINFLAGLPGIGVERSQDILDWANNNLGHALMGLTDVEIKAPVPVSVRWGIRHMLGLQDNQQLFISEKELRNG